MKIIMFILAIMLFSAVGGCVTPVSNSQAMLIENNSSVKKIALCGSGIESSVGAKIIYQASKNNGQLSLEAKNALASDAEANGIFSGDKEKFQKYVDCVLELDKRERSDKASEIQLKLSRPALRVYLGSSSDNKDKRSLIVENRGEDLSELSVEDAPILVLRELCTFSPQNPCSQNTTQNLSKAFLPIENYFSSLSIFGEYQGKVFEQGESESQVGFNDFVHLFEQDSWNSNKIDIASWVMLFVKVSYKDKFGERLDRYYEVSIQQKEIDSNFGAAVFDYYRQAKKDKIIIDVKERNGERLKNLWEVNKLQIGKLNFPLKMID